MSASLDVLIDGTWAALRPSLFRRAILGRQRCSELVMITLANFPDREFAGCKRDGSADRRLRKRLTETVCSRYKVTHAGDTQGAYGSVFLSIVLYWAVSAIVQYLVIEWWKRRFDVSELRQRYGWGK